MPPLVSSDFQDDFSFDNTIGIEIEQPQKCVRFSLKPMQVVEIQHFEDYTEEERRASWLTIDELRHIKKRCKMIALELAEKGTSYHEECTRGLEDVTNPKKRELRRVIYGIIARNQSHSGGVPMDSDLLAAEYAYVCRQSMKKARKAGVRDQRIAAFAW